MLKNIKNVAIDVDGTLTDGMYSISSNEIITKNFYTRDFAALERILIKGYNVIIITSSSGECISAKLKSNKFLSKYNNLFIISAIENKAAFIEDLRKGKFAIYCPIRLRVFTLKFDWKELVYIGDAGNDLESMKLAGYSACPSDAEKPILKIAKYVSSCCGGHGAVADSVKRLLEIDNEKG